MTFEAREKAIVEREAAGGESEEPELQSESCKMQNAKSPDPDPEPVAEERSPFCAFVKEDGQTCRAMARRPSEFCFWHEPARLAARQSEQSGGTSEPSVFEPCELKTGADVYGLLERAALYAALTPRPDLQRLKTLNVLASTLLRAIHVKELEGEVAALRADLAETNKKYDRCWREADREREELWALREENSTWFGERNKLRSYLRSIGTDPDSLPEEWLIQGRSIFEHPP